MYRILFTFVIIFTLIFSRQVFAQNTFKIGEAVIDSIKRYDLNVSIPSGKEDSETFIPITVINGKKGGATVLVVAGVHGYEYAPILAAEKLADEIDPKDLMGRLIIVRVAHIASFEARSPFVNPYDRKNLNRSFPGNPKGTQTERIAHALSTELIAKADIVFDMHSGDGSEWLEAFVGVYGGPLATDYSKAKRLAEAFGFPNIVRYDMNTQKQIDTGRSLNRQAVAQGLPTLLIEIGENGKRNDDHIKAITTGVKNALITLEMLNGMPDQSNKNTRYFEGTSSVKAKHSGIWHPVSSGARFVKQGDVIGIINGYDGKLVETVVSPINGYTLYGHAGPPVIKGEAVVTIGKPKG